MHARILAIQFRKNPSSILQEQVSIKRELGDSVVVDFVDALDDTVDWDEPASVIGRFDGLILGGSGDFDFDGGRRDDDPAKQMSYALLDRLRPLFSYVFEHDLPTLGICYGHQILGAFAGAQVHSDGVQRKTRSHEVRLLVDRSDHFLFSDLPEAFPAHYGHKDVLDRVPEGAVLLMHGGEQCKVSALVYRKNIYTTQFHPEITLEDMVLRMRNSPGYLPEGAIVEELFSTDRSSNRILANFARFVIAHSDERR